ncbi:hypothetical protein M3J07_006651 [Ascochyta lentis]
MAPPRSPTASRSPYKKAPGKRARSAAPPDPAPPTTRSTKRARLTAEDVELDGGRGDRGSLRRCSR